jgi:hypothetical protein
MPQPSCAVHNHRVLGADPCHSDAYQAGQPVCTRAMMTVCPCSCLLLGFPNMCCCVAFVCCYVANVCCCAVIHPPATAYSLAFLTWVAGWLSCVATWQTCVAVQSSTHLFCVQSDSSCKQDRHHPKYRKTARRRGLSKEDVPCAPAFDVSCSSDASSRSVPRAPAFNISSSSDSNSPAPLRAVPNPPQLPCPFVLGRDTPKHACLLSPTAAAFVTPCCLDEGDPWSNERLRVHEHLRSRLRTASGQAKTQVTRTDLTRAQVSKQIKLVRQKTWVRVVCGGESAQATIGWARYMAAEEVRLGATTAADCMLEGCAGMTPAAFLERYVLRGAVRPQAGKLQRGKGKRSSPAKPARPAVTRDTKAWRIQFEFRPCIQDDNHANHPGSEPLLCLTTTDEDVCSSNEVAQLSPEAFARLWEDMQLDKERREGASAGNKRPRVDPKKVGDPLRTPPARSSFASSLASSLVRSYSRTPDSLPQSRRNRLRRSRYAEKKLVATACLRVGTDGDASSDKLLAAALSTKTGMALLPLTAAAVGSRWHFDMLVRNTNELLDGTGRRHKHELVYLLTSGLPSAFMKKELRMTDRQIKQSRQTPEADSIADAKYKENTKKNSVPSGMDSIFMQFFVRSTYQCSGADDDRARIMSKPFFEWSAQLHADWPGLLREMAMTHPELVPDLDNPPAKGWSNFDACLLSATLSPPEDPKTERTTRFDDSLTAYARHLGVVKGDFHAKTEKEKEVESEDRAARRKHRREGAATFHPATYEIVAPTLETFRAWLTFNKLRFTCISTPHPCPLCTVGPTNELVFLALQDKLVALKAAGEPVPPEVIQEMAVLRRSLRIYRIHVLQLETARAAAQRAEENLLPGEAMIIRDFVNHHDHGGAHVKCLIWVVIWRDVDGEPLKRLKLRHYCSNAANMNCDSYYQADVVDFHLDESNSHCPRIFSAMHTLIFVGDHGVHFADHQTMHNESTLFRRFGKKVRCLFLASYHAYSRADGAGSEDSTALRRDLRAGMPRFGAAAFTEMTNSSSDQASWAYEFPEINRNEDTFPDANHFKAKDHAKWIRKWNETQYVHGGLTIDWDGIMQYRMVSGVGPFQWTDLLAAMRSPSQRMCDSCSTKANKRVLHTQEDCPAPAYIHDLPEFVDLKPDPARIKGPQVAKRSAKKKTTSTFACKYITCDHYRMKRKYFRAAKTANTHMLVHHAATAEEYELIKYHDPHANVPDAVPGPASKPKRKKVPKKTKPREDAPEPADAGGDNGRDAGVHVDSSDGDNEDTDSHAGSDINPLPDSETDIGDNENSDEDDKEESDEDVNDDLVALKVVEHRINELGKSDYLVQWVGYSAMSWQTEKDRRVPPAMRADFHASEAARIKASKLNRRSLRSSSNSGNSAETELARVDRMTAQLVREGVSFWKAREKARGQCL